MRFRLSWLRYADVSVSVCLSVCLYCRRRCWRCTVSVCLCGLGDGVGDGLCLCPVCMSVCLYVCLSVRLYVCLCVRIRRRCWRCTVSVCLCGLGDGVGDGLCLSVCMYVCLSVRLYVCLCVCIRRRCWRRSLMERRPSILWCRSGLSVRCDRSPRN